VRRRPEAVQARTVTGGQAVLVSRTPIEVEKAQMSEISVELVRKLREATSLPMMDCKKALGEVGGDFEKAKDLLRIRGLKAAEKKGGRTTAQGIIAIYHHHDKRRASLVEVNCETDFVARGEKFQAFASDLAKHVVAMRPSFVSRQEIPEDVRRKEEELILAESAAEMAGKPEAARAKMVEGRMRKFYQQHCLLDQNFVLDETKTVEALVRELIASIGENVRIRRFARMEVGD